MLSWPGRYGNSSKSRDSNIFLTTGTAAVFTPHGFPNKVSSHMGDRHAGLVHPRIAGLDTRRASVELARSRDLQPTGNRISSGLRAFAFGWLLTRANAKVSVEKAEPRRNQSSCSCAYGVSSFGDALSIKSRVCWEGSLVLSPNRSVDSRGYDTGAGRFLRVFSTNSIR